MDLLILRLAGLLNDAAGSADAGIVRSSVAVGFVVCWVFGEDAVLATDDAVDCMGAAASAAAPDAIEASTPGTATPSAACAASWPAAAAVVASRALSTSETSWAVSGATGNAPVVSPATG
ncbi:hypothetical protein [Pararobbsia alpina]|uniref:hypothetical protein n=1 Tax=Pararobbsia alpina TaxID=621374 RepID=UPI0039A5845F